MSILLVTQEPETFAHMLRVAMTNPVVWLTLLTMAVIPLLNALLTKVNTHPAMKSAVAAVIASVYAVITWLTTLGHVVIDWKQALGIFAITLIGAGGFGKAIWAGPVVDWIHSWSDKSVGVGPVMTPEKAMRKHGSPATVAVPPNAKADVGVPHTEIEGLPRQYHEAVQNFDPEV